MAFYLSVIGGADEGRSFRLDSGDYIIGRSPSAKVILKEESVAWEHALLKVDGVKLTVQNLSAAGTKVKGRKIAEPTRLASHDEIQLSDNCRLLVEQRMSGSGQVSPFVLGLLLVLLLIIVGFGFKQLSAGGVAERPMEPQHWRQAYTRIVDRVEHWAQLGYFPGELLLMFRNAWRLDQVGANQDAAEMWTGISKALLSLPVPGASAGDPRTCVQIAGPDTRILQVLMGYDRKTQVGDSDEVYVDALVWFAKKRAQRTRALSKGG